MEREDDADRRLFSGAGHEETLSLIEGVGPAQVTRKESKRTGGHDELLLIALVMASIVILAASIFAAMRSRSTIVYVEVFGTGGDVISYLASLICVYAVRDKSEEKREKIEFGTAIFSTLLLLVAGGKVLMQCYFQMRCALDNEYHFHHIPCSYLQARPDPYYVLMLEGIAFLAYIPVVVVGCFYTDLEQYKPATNISHASAILHAFVDVTQLVIVSIAAGCMMQWAGESVQIDVVACMICLFFMLVATTLMWSNYYFHWTADPELLASRRASLAPLSSRGVNAGV